MLPTAEDCATPADDDCDGVAPACEAKWIWAKRFGTQLGDGATSVITGPGSEVDPGTRCEGKTDFGGGVLPNVAPCVAKLGPSGEPLWSKSYGQYTTNEPHALTLDLFGNLIVAGGFLGDFYSPGGTLQAMGTDVFVLN